MNGKIATAAVSALMLISLISVMVVAPVSANPEEETIVLYNPTTWGANARGATESYIGCGSWANDPSDKMELYLTPELLFGEDITINDIAEISYHTLKSDPQGGVNFYINIYTMPYTDGDSTWYGNRLTLEPMYSYNFDDVVGEWNTWTTNAGTNQLTVFDSNHAPYGWYYPPILDNIQAGPINWRDWTTSGENIDIDYASQTVKYIVIATGNPWCATFEGYVDALTIKLKDGASVTVDLEPGVINQNTKVGYNTIQEAIDNANPGDTVLVYPGIYNERLTISKSIALHGAQYGVDPTATGARTNPADESIITEAGLPTPDPDVLIEIPAGVSGVTVDGFTLNGDQTNTTADTSVVRIWGDDITISNNIIDGMFGVIYKGGETLTVHQNRMVVNKDGVIVQPGSATNVTISNNVFSLGTSPAGDESAIYMTSCTNSSVTGNAATGFDKNAAFAGSNLHDLTISGNTFTGNAGGISIWGNSTFITISNNVLSNSLTATWDDSGCGISIKGQDLEITGNEITNNADIGIKIARHVIDTERVTVSNNNIYGNKNYGIKIISASDVTVQGNTFQNNSVQVQDNAEVLNILDVAENNTFDRAVIVETASYLPFIWSSIQDAINDASPGDTVLVYPGTYNENINIDKSLTVRSVEGAEVTIINAQEASMGVLINGADTVATFDGFTVENYLTAGILAGAFSPTWGDDPVEVHILNNIVKEPMGEAHNNCIQLGDGTTGTVIGNEVSGAFLESPDWSGSGIIVAGSSNVLVSNNYVHDCESGIVVLGYDYKNAPAENNVIRNNTVENCEAGISIEALVIDTTIENNWVINNEITGIQVYGYDNLWGIEASVPAGTKIHYNDIVGNKDYGVVSSVWGSGGVVSAEQVDATHNWWGHPSGPRRDRGNPNCKAGRGDRVSENVRYHPWLSKPFQTVLEKHVGHYGFEGRYLEKGWNTLSVPIYLDNNAWEEIAAYLDENIAYRFNASTQAWELMTTDSKLDPLDAIYIRMNSENSVPLVVSVSITNPPVKELKRGWNLIGLAVWEVENMSVDRALVSVELTPDGKRGYTIVVSSSLNQEYWAYTIGQTKKQLMHKNEGYWVYMENPGNLAGFSTTPLPFWEPE